MKPRARQREFGFTNWGGKRRGAGRKPSGARAGVTHAKRPRLSAHHPVLVTLRLRSGLRSLRERGSHDLVRCALAASSMGERFRVVEYSVQSNHVHLLVESHSARELARAMNGLTVRVVRGFQRLWKVCGRLLADRYHARSLQTPRMVRAALVYVLQNARKHGAWVAAWPDVYSSGGSFTGSRGPSQPPASAARDAESSTPWIARARTWLLSIGWRRHRLLGPLEEPAPARLPP